MSFFTASPFYHSHVGSPFFFCTFFISFLFSSFQFYQSDQRQSYTFFYIRLFATWFLIITSDLLSHYYKRRDSTVGIVEVTFAEQRSSWRRLTIVHDQFLVGRVSLLITDRRSEPRSKSYSNFPGVQTCQSREKVTVTRFLSLWKQQSRFRLFF